MTSSPRALLGLAPDALDALMAKMALPPYRARQVHAWLYERHATDFNRMTDLPHPVRESLATDWCVTSVRLLGRQMDPASGTHKFLFGLADGRQVEGVLLLNRDRPATLCISSQVGCPVGCLFCATGTMGYTRNMTTEEILGQIEILLGTLAGEMTSKTHPNIVFMGMGEPLMNLKSIVPALEAIADPRRLCMSPRRVTLSTIGVPDGIRTLAQLDRGFHLALSLHHPDEARRRALMPHAKASLDDVFAALTAYADKTGRLVTIEYVLLGGVNDGPREAQGVVARVRQLGCAALLNIIPYNPVEGAPFVPSTEGATQAFVARLRRAGVRTTVRRTQGTAIDAACGQLALKGFDQAAALLGRGRLNRPATLEART